MARTTRKTTKINPGDLKVKTMASPAAVVVLQGAPPDIGLHRVIDRPCIIGRGPGVDFALLGQGVSRRHCVLLPDRGNVRVQDLNSTNGTLVNGKRIPGPTLLNDGDHIFMGDTILKFSAADSPDYGYHVSMDERVGTDDLTGLIARTRFEGDLVRALEECASAGEPMGVMMLDMDGIKEINDTYGHIYGAHTISEAGKIIGRVIHLYGEASRLGGDEFAAFLPSQGKAVTVDLARLIVRLINEHKYEKDGVIVHPTISVGVAAFPVDGKTAGEVLKRADQALYRAKRAGRNCVAT